MKNVPENLTLNKNLIAEIGLHATLIYEVLSDMFTGDYFSITTKELMYETSLGKQVIESNIKKLIELKLVTKTQMGIPNRNYYALLYDPSLFKQFITDGAVKRYNLRTK